ncbi:hypothetical protein HNQ75_004584 [Rhizobium flavum]|uniref:Uncharacterized protein n=3 Tax=Pseudorhizobium flavum TaxID=1335061 RepID=A0A7W9Z212_9HYPH|nr:hypothetical protein [Pseudorhizobium flavum]MBB6182595.1 hypothetical protein [Pseudorhizobium flavum]
MFIFDLQSKEVYVPSAFFALPGASQQEQFLLLPRMFRATRYHDLLERAPRPLYHTFPLSKANDCSSRIMGKRVHPRPTWTLILRDGSRHQIEAAVTFEIFAGVTKVAATHIGGDPEAIAKAFSEGEAAIEGANGKRYRVAVEKIGRGWRIIG